jgi:hypothetical protein
MGSDRRPEGRPPRLARALLAAWLAAWPAAWRAPAGPLPVAPPHAQRFDPDFPPLHAQLAPRPARRRMRGVPMAPAPAWSTLLAQAADEDPVAACRLALLLDDCRLLRDVEAMSATRLSMALREGRAAGEAAAEIAALEFSADPLRTACGDAPAELVAHGWSFLLRAALAGHEASMYRFVTDPPLDPARPDEAAAALQAWRTHAAPLLGALLQRASPQALPLAYRAAQGVALVADQPLQPRDAFATLRYGAALARLNEDDSNLTVQLEGVEAELSPARRRQARAEGARLAVRFQVAAEASGGSAGREECASGWPGMAHAWAVQGD